MTVRVPVNVILEANDAVQLMESKGSHLTWFSCFGSGPLVLRNDLVQQRHDTFFSRYPDLSPFLHSCEW